MPSILLIKTSSLGDVIHNLPVVSDLRRIWLQAKIDWVVEEAFADIPRMHPGVRTVIPVAVRRWRRSPLLSVNRLQMQSFIDALRLNEYDRVIDTQGLFKSALLARLARGLRCGYARKVAREPLAAFFYQRHFTVDCALHAVVRNRQLVADAAGYSLDDLPLDYGLASPLFTHEQSTCAPYAVLLTATSRDDKRWPEGHWIELGRALHQQGLQAMLPAGNEQERARAQRIASAIPSAELVPPSSIRELATLMSHAQCVAGVDTGLTHLAAALNRPVAAIYVATQPGLTGVYAGPLAVNLGGVGQMPDVAEVLVALKNGQSVQNEKQFSGT